MAAIVLAVGLLTALSGTVILGSLIAGLVLALVAVVCGSIALDQVRDVLLPRRDRLVMMAGPVMPAVGLVLVVFVWCILAASVNAAAGGAAGRIHRPADGHGRCAGGGADSASGPAAPRPRRRPCLGPSSPRPAATPAARRCLCLSSPRPAAMPAARRCLCLSPRRRDAGGAAMPVPEPKAPDAGGAAMPVPEPKAPDAPAAP